MGCLDTRHFMYRLFTHGHLTSYQYELPRLGVWQTGSSWFVTWVVAVGKHSPWHCCQSGLMDSYRWSPCNVYVGLWTVHRRLPWGRGLINPSAPALISQQTQPNSRANKLCWAWVGLAQGSGPLINSITYGYGVNRQTTQYCGSS